jgi:hypothetical protein
MPPRLGISRDLDPATMDTPEAHAQAMAGSVEDWATESLLAARGAHRDPVNGMWIKPGARLADAYQDASLLVVRRRLYLGREYQWRKDWNKMATRRVFPGLRGRNQAVIPGFPPELDV